MPAKPRETAIIALSANGSMSKVVRPAGATSTRLGSSECWRSGALVGTTSALGASDVAADSLATVGVGDCVGGAAEGAIAGSGGVSAAGGGDSERPCAYACSGAALKAPNTVQTASALAEIIGILAKDRK